jgi:RNA binding exosome subunit
MIPSKKKLKAMRPTIFSVLIVMICASSTAQDRPNKFDHLYSFYMHIDKKKVVFNDTTVVKRNDTIVVTITRK